MVGAMGTATAHRSLPSNIHRPYRVPLGDRTRGIRSRHHSTRFMGGGARTRAGSESLDLATGTPGFQTLVTGEGYSIRLYDTHFVVRTAYSRRDEGFDTLGSYLDGNNEASVRIPAPQPVVMTYLPGGSKIMQLFVPTPKEGMPPLPLAPGVSLEVAGGQALAVTEFTGYATKEAAARARESLTAALAKDGLSVSDDVFLIAQYGPLFSLSTRVNELLVPVKL